MARPAATAARGVTRIALLAAVATLGAAATAADGVVGTGVEHRAWTVDLPGPDATFAQTLVYTRVDLPDFWGSADLRGYLPLATSRDDDLDEEISGAGDAQLRLICPAFRTGWTLSLGADVPTGQTGLTRNEALVAARTLGSRVLDFGLKRPGEGLDLMLGASRAIRAGRTTVAGIALAGHFKGEYALYEENGVERTAAPGHRLHASVSLLAREHPDDPDWTLDLTLGGQWAGDYGFEAPGTEITIAEGAQVLLDGLYRRRAGDAAHLDVTAHLFARGSNEVTGGTIVETEVLGLSTRWMTALGLGYTRAVGTIGDLSAGAGHTLFRNEATGDVNSRVTSLELGLRRAFGERVRVNAGAGYAFGSTPWKTGAGSDEAATRESLAGTTLGIGFELVF